MMVALCLKMDMRFYVGAIASVIAYAVCAFTFKTLSVLDLFSSLIELLITLIAVLAFSKVAKLFERRRKRRVFTDEEVVSISFRALICVMGGGSIGAGGVYLREIFSFFLTFLFAYAGGTGIGTAAGVFSALACVVAGSPAAFMGVAGVVGAAAGASRGFKKPGVLIAGSGAALFSILYISAGQVATGSIWSFLLSAVAFLCLPGRVLDKFCRFVDWNVLWVYQKELREERFRELTIGRLNEIAEVFSRVGEVFSDSAKKPEEPKISYAMSEIPEMACEDCPLYRTCWDGDFQETYELMQRLYGKYAKKGQLAARDLGAFSKKCLAQDKLLAAARTVFQKFDTNAKWEQKIAVSRSMVGEQMKSVSRVIDSLKKEVQVDMDFLEDLEARLRMQADEKGVEVTDVAAVNRGGALQIEAVVRTKRPELSEKRIAEAVAECTGALVKPIYRKEINERRKLFRMSFEQVRNFDIQTGAACAVKKGGYVSGDAHSRESLRDGRFMMLLCDGMGSGERAAKESSIAVSLMEDFYKADFDDKTVLDAINKLLLLSSSDDMYSTMDCALIDLIEGKLKLIKIGAPYSILIKKDGIRRFSSGSLPMGILEDYQPIIYEEELQKGDTLIMFTDGLADMENKYDGFYKQVLEFGEMRNAQEIADCILEYALRLQGGQAEDDMSVMVGRIV